MGGAVTEAAGMYPETNYAIVDVDVTVDKDGNKVEAPSNLLGIMFRAQEPSFPVSYTHLDVYKRQLLYCALLLAIQWHI